MKKRSASAGTKSPRIPPWEWAVATTGVLLVLGMIGFMGFRALRGDSNVPELQVQARETHAHGGGFVVVVRVNNAGGGAANVAIEGDLVEAGNTVESAAATLDYVPARSHRAAGLLFTHDPSRYTLRLRATGYEEP